MTFAPPQSQVNLFTMPTQFFEKAFNLLIPYHHCAYINETSRITLVPDTGRGSAVVQQTLSKVGGAYDNFQYQYDVTTLPATALVGRNDNPPYGRTRFSMTIPSPNSDGENCRVWSTFANSITMPLVDNLKRNGRNLALLLALDLFLIVATKLDKKR